MPAGALALVYLQTNRFARAVGLFADIEDEIELPSQRWLPAPVRVDVGLQRMTMTVALPD